MIALIAAYDKNRVIGNNGKIPWELPEDKRRFRELTTGHVVVMGRRTYEEIGHPLPDRETILISATRQVTAPHCTTVKTLAEALERADGKKVFICGGEQLYREALPLAEVLYLTELDSTFAGDRHFPEFDASDYLLEREETVAGSVPHTNRIYRKKPLTMEKVAEILSNIQKTSGIVPGLETLRAFLKRLGNPQNKTQFLHIAGTNGKGSVGAMLATVLQKAGYRVGHFASPAVFDPLEVWRVNGQPIAKKDYLRRMTTLLSNRAAMASAGETVPTVFELETALAFVTFAQEQCDLAILECGMGGAEDATNVITTTIVSVLTSIGLDHTAFLGNTLEEIARQKGGIIKDGVPVVLQSQSHVVEETIREICKAHNSPLILTQREAVAVPCFPEQGACLRYRGKDWKLSLSGAFQGQNGAEVIEAVEVLRSLSMEIPEKALAEGLAQTVWPGRFETIYPAPRVILDGAHNPDAARKLRRSMEELRASGWQGKLFLLLGVLGDKDHREVASLLAGLAQQVCTVTPDNPRALSAEKLLMDVLPFCKKAQALPLKQAIAQLLQQAGKDDILLICGSLSYLGAARQIVEEITGGGESHGATGCDFAP
ncbi:MAG: dihydrofolate reductase [Oscillospiraceae bacterium]|nr:dihydrofolate reductase [Oscillospiraceae bacterium]